jgi:predicted metal-dependent enzyme (double-stranded beta helix superfamily)
MDWLVRDTGDCLPLDSALSNGVNGVADGAQVEPYRLYRFLTDVEDVLRQVEDVEGQLRAICPLVRHLLVSSEWLPMAFDLPDPQLGWSVRMLYDEPNFPLTVQMVAWAPGQVSPIHNHGAWGLVALLSGQECNQLWRRSPTTANPDRIERTGEHLLMPGEIITFTPGAIHSVEAIADEPTISFNLYGETDYAGRFEFDPVNLTAKVF